MDIDDLEIDDYGHAGLVAGFIKDIGLIEYIDHVIPKTQACHVTHGQAIAAMLLNALGFHISSDVLSARVLSQFTCRLINWSKRKK